MAWPSATEASIATPAAAIFFRTGLRGQIAHHVLAPGAGASRKPTAQDFCHGGQVGPYAELFLGTAGSHAETGDDLVEDQQRADAPRFFTKRRDERRGRGHGAEMAAG